MEPLPLIWNIDVNHKSIIFAETMEPHGRDEENEYILQDMIRDGGDVDDVEQYLIDYGEGVEGEDNGSREEWSEKMTAPVRKWSEKMTVPVLEP